MAAMSNTTTETITVNRSNWTGESMEVTINRSHGLFQIAHYGDYSFGLLPRPKQDDYESFSIYIDGQITDMRVSRFADDSQWLASDYFGEITREHKDPFVAAALLLAMTL